jgi:hypothetical protein
MRLLFLLTFALWVYAPLCLAQTPVRVRASDQDGYSRIVFDWGKNVSYDLTRSGNRITIKFGKNASVDAAVLAAARAANITGASIVSSSPLEISIGVPETSRARDFAAGTRVIIDVYDPPGAPRKTAPPKTPPVKKEPEPNRPVPEKAVKMEAPPTATVAAVPVAPVQAEKPLDPPPVAIETAASPPEENLKDAPPPPQSNLITVSSIEVSGLAVFKRDGKVYILSDSEDDMVMPTLSGPNSKSLLPMKTYDIDGGRLFSLTAPAEPGIRGQGGGLLWRVIVPAGPARTPPIAPERLKSEKPNEGESLFWRMEDARVVFDVPDPVTGKTLKVATVTAAKQYAGPAHKYVEFEVLESPVGIAILPRTDDLSVTIEEGNVVVSRPGGLHLADEKDADTMASAQKSQIPKGAQANAKRVFDFKNWQMGGIEETDHNRAIILSDIGGKEGHARAEGLLKLGKMYLSNGMWAEAKGFLSLAADEIPELNQNPSFIALVGAANAMGHENEDAFKALSLEDLKIYPEIGYWRAFALADLGDWQQAEAAMPPELFILSDYPPIIRTKLSLTLAEVVLRAGDAGKADTILGFVDEYQTQLNPSQKAALQYLKGESARQKDQIAETRKLWQPLTRGNDPLYRAKARLALTRLLVDKKEMKVPKAIDNLERLRYAWRGDDLEAQIAYWLGRTYFENKDYVRGLTIMREAASYAVGSDIGTRISNEMMQVFLKLFTGPDLDSISAVDAASLHEKFSDLLPPGPETDRITERLAERFVKADLLNQAVDLLQSRLTSAQAATDMPTAYRLAVRMAGISLLNDTPGKAIIALDASQDAYSKLPTDAQTPEGALEITLLRARALSKQERADQALALLKTAPRSASVNILKADIAWHAAYWGDAADALQDVLIDRNIVPSRALEPQDTALILQRAVALNLAGDRVGLAAMREEFNDPLAKTDKGKIFEVITRARQSAALADRETLMSVVSEVDLFKDFLSTYKGEAKPAAPVKDAP